MTSPRVEKVDSGKREKERKKRKKGTRKKQGKKREKGDGKRGQIYLSTSYNDEAIDLLTTNRSNSCRYD
jgi:hypothetical protein